MTDVPPPQDVRPDARTLAEGAKLRLLDHAPGRLTTALRLAIGEEDA